MARNTENLRLFKDGCWKKKSPANSTIFVDLWISINSGVSSRKLVLNFYYVIQFFNMCSLSLYIYYVVGGSRGSFISIILMARNTENPRFFKEYSP